MSDVAELVRLRSRLLGVVDRLSEGEVISIAEMMELANAMIERERAKNADLKHKAQSYYELLRECQAELRSHGSVGMVETIDRVLSEQSK